MPHRQIDDVEFNKRIGALIRSRRLELGMSQTKLSEKLSVSFQQVQKYENGSNRASAVVIRELAKALALPISAFFGGDDHAPDYLPNRSTFKLAQEIDALPPVARDHLLKFLRTMTPQHGEAA